jgi:hypothetical protein
MSQYFHVETHDGIAVVHFDAIQVLPDAKYNAAEKGCRNHAATG